MHQMVGFVKILAFGVLVIIVICIKIYLRDENVPAYNSETYYGDHPIYIFLKFLITYLKLSHSLQSPLPHSFSH